MWFPTNTKRFLYKCARVFLMFSTVHKAAAVASRVSGLTLPLSNDTVERISRIHSDGSVINLISHIYVVSCSITERWWDGLSANSSQSVIQLTQIKILKWSGGGSSHPSRGSATDLPSDLNVVQTGAKSCSIIPLSNCLTRSVALKLTAGIKQHDRKYMKTQEETETEQPTFFLPSAVFHLFMEDFALTEPFRNSEHIRQKNDVCVDFYVPPHAEDYVQCSWQIHLRCNIPLLEFTRVHSHLSPAAFSVKSYHKLSRKFSPSSDI